MRYLVVKVGCTCDGSTLLLSKRAEKTIVGFFCDIVTVRFFILGHQLVNDQVQMLKALLINLVATCCLVTSSTLSKNFDWRGAHYNFVFVLRLYGCVCKWTASLQKGGKAKLSTFVFGFFDELEWAAKR